MVKMVDINCTYILIVPNNRKIVKIFFFFVSLVSSSIINYKVIKTTAEKLKNPSMKLKC